MSRTAHRLFRWLAAASAATVLALPAGSTAAYQDLRNPDTRDASDTLPQAGATEPSPQPEISKEPSFDWRDAGIGAGSVLGLVLIALAVMFGVVHRRRRGAAAEHGSALSG